MGFVVLETSFLIFRLDYHVVDVPFGFDGFETLWGIVCWNILLDVMF